MSAIATLKSWFEGYAQDLGTELNWDGDGCALELSDGTLIEIGASDETEGVYIYSNLMECPKDEQEKYEVFYRALTMNLHQAEALGGAICLSPDDKNILLSYSRNISDLTPESLANTLDLFIGSAIESKGILNYQAPEEADDEEAPAN
jgi:hypothetical protein